MKNVLLLTKRQLRHAVLAAWAIVVIAGTAVSLPSANAEEVSVRDLYKQARAAFYQGRYQVAKPKLIKVVKAAPNFAPAKALLSQILAAEKKAGPKNSMLGWANRLKLPKINVEDATVEEVITFLRVKSRELSKGKWEPNFVLRLPDGEAPVISISLRDVPVSYVVKRMAELSGLAVRYDEHAITVAPKELLPPEPDPAHLAAEAAAKARRPLLRETKKNE